MHTADFQRLRTNLQEKKVELIAVSKFKSPVQILDVYAQGQRIFAENKVQDLLPKYEYLPKDIQWHMIGHLQKNKVKYIVPFVAMIQSVDSFALLLEIEKKAAKAQRVIDFLFQMYIAKEETKYGLDEEELLAILDNPDFKRLRHVRPRGVMGMATQTDDRKVVREEFRALKKIFTRVKERYFSTDALFKEISMGMSGDYEIAIAEGSTMVRLGTVIFGERPGRVFTIGEL